jgi:hypothetical protein
MNVAHRTMTRLSRLLGGVFLGAALLAAPSARAAALYGDITVEYTSPPQPGGIHGYIEYRFLITNSSTQDAHEVRLTLPQVSYGGGRHRLRSVSRTVQVGPSRRVTVSLFQPDLPLAGDGLAVTVDGRRPPHSPTVNLQREDLRRGGGSPWRPHLLVSQSIANQLPWDFDIARDDRHMWDTTKAGSESWLGYSACDAVVLAAGDLDALPAKVRSALVRYVECGGFLLVVGPWQPPKPWGWTPAPPTGARGNAAVAPLQSYLPGFGQCIVSPAPDLTRLDPAQRQHIAEAWRQTAKPFMRERSVSMAHLDFPVVEDVSTPVRGLFVVMLLFAIAIGPVNVYVLARAKRKIWMLWTVPAIALVTSLGVLGYVFLKEGWTGHVRAEGLTILDEAAGRATTVGWVGFYSPVTPGDGLHFGYETELTPQLVELSVGPGGRDVRYDYRRGGTQPTIDWSNDQHLATGWVTARTPAHFMLRKTEARKEHVVVRRAEDGTFTVENGLGAAIHRFWYADDQGRVHTAADVPAEGRARLTAHGDQVAQGAPHRSLRQAYGMDWLKHYEELTERPGLYLRPGCYIAALKDAPFIEPGLREGQRKGRSIVYGIGKEPADAR